MHVHSTVYRTQRNRMYLSYLLLIEIGNVLLDASVEFLGQFSTIHCVVDYVMKGIHHLFDVQLVDLAKQALYSRGRCLCIRRAAIFDHQEKLGLGVGQVSVDTGFSKRQQETHEIGLGDVFSLSRVGFHGQLFQSIQGRMESKPALSGSRMCSRGR